MAKAFFRLKDTGSSFYDPSQAAGVVADRTQPLELTAAVMRAERDGVLIRVEKSEGKATFDQEQAAIAKAKGLDKSEVPKVAAKEIVPDSQAPKIETEPAPADTKKK